MADATLTSVDDDGTIIGTNFTQTTTTVQVDGIDAGFSYVSSTELQLDEPPPIGAKITVSKGGVTSPALTFGPPGSGDEPADVTTTELPAGGSGGGSLPPVSLAAEEYLTQQEKGAPDPVAPVAEQTTATPLDIGIKQPYPEGAPAVPPAAGVPMNQMPPASEPETPPTAPEVA
jgi:hypothetical protein